MNKKHFEAIASVLNENYASIDLVLDMAGALELEDFNDQFDLNEFVVLSTRRLREDAAYVISTIDRAAGK